MPDESKSMNLLLVPKNPLGMSEKDLRPLAEELTGDGFNVQFAAREQRGYGVTWWEALAIYFGSRVIDSVTGNALDSLVNAVKDKVVAWYHGRREQKGTKRPFAIEIRDYEGNLLKSYHLTPNGELDETAQSGPKSPPPVPIDD